MMKLVINTTPISIVVEGTKGQFECIREVGVTFDINGKLHAIVGRARVVWDKVRYPEAPYIDIPGVRHNTPKFDRARLLVVKFIEEYFMTLNKDTRISLPVNHVEEKNSSAQYSDEHVNRVSTYPRWMTEEHKEWVLCEGPKRKYWARRTIKPESLEIVSQYRAFCSRCNYRQNCTKSCNSPEIKSLERIM